MTEKEMHNLLQEIASTLGMLPGDDLNDIPEMISHIIQANMEAQVIMKMFKLYEND